MLRILPGQMRMHVPRACCNTRTISPLVSVTSCILLQVPRKEDDDKKGETKELEDGEKKEEDGEKSDSESKD